MITLIATVLLKTLSPVLPMSIESIHPGDDRDAFHRHPDGGQSQSRFVTGVPEGMLGVLADRGHHDTSDSRLCQLMV